jgi:cellulose synthase/poly-beta-1,6-N-acetylglucosamine synthase-like glycosyltransferase
MGSFQALAELGYPVTAVGNNMGWRRTAYQALGGYEALPFSLVEDYQLFRAMRAAGWAVRLPAEAPLLNRSAAVGHLRTLLRQRRRWLQGARQSGAPLYARLPFIVQAVLVLGAGTAALALGAPWALALLGLKAATDAAFLAAVNHRLGLGQRATWRWLLPHQLYLLLALVLLPAYLYWPGPTVWKGRAIRTQTN